MKTPDVKSLDITSALVTFLRYDAVERLSLQEGSLDRDIATLCRRVASEGESFLTKTLPKLGKAIDLSLQGHLPLITAGFKTAGRTAIPAFLQVMLRGVFEANTGMLKSIICLESLKLLRQVCYWFYKLEGVCDEQQITRAIDNFVDCDKSLPSPGSNPWHGSRVLSRAKAITACIFRKMDVSRLRPKHGPGAVAGGEKGPDKYVWHRYADICKTFPFFKWFWNFPAIISAWGIYAQVKTCAYGLSKLMTVPKDSRGPRIIGLEPKEYMWVQQALKDWLYSHLESCILTTGHVNFTDQEVNRKLALNPDYVTLDMKEASDRVSCALVEQLFPIWLLKFFFSARTPGTILPDGTVLMYNKFAPMGSAICFPVEAICFYTLAVSAVIEELAVPYRVAMKQIYVYGDDLIVPQGWEIPIFKHFPAFKLKLNEDKCCTRGYFRESCGMDAFSGQEVTPVRLKRRIITRDNLPTLVAHINNLYVRGYRHAASELRRQVDFTLPTVPDAPTCGFLAWQGEVAEFHYTMKFRYNHGLQRTERKLYTVGPVQDILDHDAYDRCLLPGYLSSAGPSLEKSRDGKLFRAFARHQRKRVSRRYVDTSAYETGAHDVSVSHLLHDAHVIRRRAVMRQRIKKLYGSLGTS